jgi:hypothetical protein
MVPHRQHEHRVAGGDMGPLILEVDVEGHDGGVEEKLHWNLG